MMSNDPIVIVSAVRTPMGGFQGELKASAPPAGCRRHQGRRGASRHRT